MKQRHDILYQFTGCKAAEHPTQQQTEPELPPRAARGPLLCLPALGVLLGFVLRLITEAVKLLLVGQ